MSEEWALRWCWGTVLTVVKVCRNWLGWVFWASGGLEYWTGCGRPLSPEPETMFGEVVAGFLKLICCCCCEAAEMAGWLFTL